MKNVEPLACMCAMCVYALQIVYVCVRTHASVYACLSVWLLIMFGSYACESL